MDTTVEVLTEAEIKDALPSLFKRSQTDLAFRKLCLSDPRAALRELTGKALPEGFKLKFLDRDDT